MKVRAIRYGRLRSLPGFNHAKLEKEVELEDGEDDGAVLNALRQDVDASLGLQEKAIVLHAQYQSAMENLHLAEHERDRVKAEAEEWRKMLRECRDFIRQAEAKGVPVPKALDDEIPF